MQLYFVCFEEGGNFFDMLCIDICYQAIDFQKMLFYGGSCFTRTIWSILSCPMDHMPAKVLHDTDENRTRNEAAETSFSRNDVKDIPKPGPITPGVNRKVNVVDWRAQEPVSPNTPIDEDRSGEVNMEASITPDDFIRAGGFGAKDDISSFLPVASD